MATQKRTTRSSRSNKSGGRKPNAKAAGSTSPILDDDSRTDIVGIALSATALALAVALMAQGTGIAGRFVADALRLGFGAGAYVLPILLLLWGVSFFVRAFAIAERRVGIGLGLVLLALISILAVSSPADIRWERSTVQADGGYLGGAVAWILTALAGPTISYILLAALMLIGLVITGLSISGVVEWLTDTFSSRAAVQPPEKLAGGRRSRTVPLSDLDGDAVADLARSESASRRRSQKAADDPERRKKTVPAAPTGAPRAMEGFVLPPMTLLGRTTEAAARHRASDRELKTMATLIEDTLATFDIPVRVVEWIPGPTVTMFELELPRGVKVNRVTTLADDLALALAAPTVRILAPIPGKSLVGIEVPNDRRSTVTLGDVLGDTGPGDGGPLLLGIGKDVSGESVLADLAAMPHLLIAGSTGTGKSVCINALLSSILMRATPAETRLILIDPKRIELSMYNGVPHLYVPVVTEAKEAASALAWAVSEMDRRLKVLQKAGVRNIASYNGMVHAGKLEEGAEQMPYLVIVIDELADLMMVAAKEVEDSICRLAQLARAAGIHLIVATQRPSTDIITGLIKTNITNRIAFAVGSSIDSRVILDQPGAEKLIGLGDMLFSIPSWPKPKRIQGAFVSEEEIAAAVDHLKAQGEPEYHEEILHLKIATVGGGVDTGDDDDPLIWEAADIVVTSGMGSTSLLQRRLKVGYARAGRIMDMLESKGIVGQPDGSRPRDVLVDIEDLESIKAMERLDAESEEE
ncbi:MAG: DNA translocase FtsK 4TM domain-containing protein [Coriobacteriia bacterium]|nr:DNA translocase FtsK 4TM domain-containing protein [Coriobacteriia bacterium]